jgi:hypothetical protein
MRGWLSIWLLSLIVVAMIASALSRAQTQAPNPRAQSQLPNLPIVSGSDIGFRVEGTKDGRAVGTLVVRINGQWVETAASLAQKPLTAR